jgi:hypothetical protein
VIKLELQSDILQRFRIPILSYQVADAKLGFTFQGLDPGPKTRELEYQIAVLYKSRWHS